MSSKYPKQCGPNLSFFDCANKPSAAITHRGCGGMMSQILGPPNQKSCDKPENTPGKIFCYDCGHKLSKAATVSIKTGADPEQFYFPGHEDYQLVSKTYININKALRYWEWRPKGYGQGALVRTGIEEHRAIARDNEDISRLKTSTIKSIAKIVPLKKRKLGALFSHSDTVTINGRFILNTGHGYAVFDCAHWSVQPFQELRRGFRATLFNSGTDLIDWLCDQADEAGISTQSIMLISSNDYEHAKNGPFPYAEEFTAPKPEFQFFGKRGPFAGQSDMLTSKGKTIISYRNEVTGNFWYMCLNPKVWNTEECQELRTLVRASSFTTPEDFAAKMVVQTRLQGKPSHYQSFQVADSSGRMQDVSFNNQDF
jgi:hypothetical protein